MSMSLDAALVLALQETVRSSEIARRMAIFSARWLIVAFVPLYAFAWWRSRQVRELVVQALWATGSATAIRTIVSKIVSRPRPYLEPTLSPYVERLIPAPFNTSFPSGHATASFALATALVFIDPVLGALGMVLAVAVAVGRVAVGVHYPSDCIAGALIGAACVFLVRWGHRQLLRRDLSRSASLHHHS